MIFGGLYVSGGIDPTYLSLEPQNTVPFNQNLQGIWMEKNVVGKIPLRVQKMKMDDFYGSYKGYIEFDPIGNQQIVISDGLSSEINNLKLNNKTILLTNTSTTTESTLTSDGAIFSRKSPSSQSASISNAGLVVGSQSVSHSGFLGSIYCEDQTTTNKNFYLTFVAAGGKTGFYAPYFDSEALRYNSGTNLLFVNGLQLSTNSYNVTISGGLATIDCNNASSREFKLSLTENMTGLYLANRRINGVYKIMITNDCCGNYMVNAVLQSGTSGQINITSYDAINRTGVIIQHGDTWVMTIKVLQSFNNTIYNCVCMEEFFK